MDYKKAFYDILDKTSEIALATSIDGIPNVRIVSICYDEARSGVIYFQTNNMNSKKVSDIAQNANVAFTTAPIGKTIANVRSNNATVCRSKHAFDELKHLFVAKVSEYEEAYDKYGHTMTVFEIHIKEAIVVVDYGVKRGIVEF
ncbi:MAG: pyridoxamine 5'-phosphate oxidase family protein [Defluviitaleaceae bacterium]|nr:pyridoxamine 5'-phosphate oxidase family protein [Defluviitaleaceae bacterium]